MTRQTFLASFTVLYMLAMMWLSWWAGRRFVKDETEFMVGGRQFNAFLTTVASLSILISGGYLPGIVMFGFLFGIGGWWYFLSWALAALVSLLCWVTFWRVSGAYTPTEWFEYRYGRESRIVISFVILVAGIAIIGWQFVGSGATMGAALGIPPASAIVILGVAVVAYVTLGGIWSATLTDTVQFTWVFLFSFLVVPVYLFLTYGVPDPAQLPDGFLDLPFGTIPVLQLTLPSVVSFALMHQSLLNQAPYWTRAASSLDRRTVTIAWTWLVIGSTGAGLLGAIVGIYVRMLVPELPDPALALGTLVDAMPVVLGACVLGGLMAATMSTVDIYMVAGVNQLIRDVAQQLLRIDDKDRLLALARWATVAYGGLCVVFALLWPDGLAALFGFGTAIGAPLFIYYLDSWLLKVGNGRGAIASALAALLVVLVWDRMTNLNEVVHSLWVVFPVTLLTLVIVSLLFPVPRRVEDTATGELTELQRDVLGAVAEGYSAAADIMDYCGARTVGVQLPGFLKELDHLSARGYVRREGERFIRQLCFHLTPEGESLAAEILEPGDAEALQRFGVGRRALGVLHAVLQQPGMTFQQISERVDLPPDAVGTIVNRLAHRRLVRIKGLVIPRVSPTDEAAGLAAAARAVA